MIHLVIVCGSTASPLAPFASISFPDSELADQLQNAYFAYRWPAMPANHRHTLLEKHFTPAMALEDADKVSLFLTFMVFALGAMDLQRQNSDLGGQHLNFFKKATHSYRNGPLVLSHHFPEAQSPRNTWG